MKETVESCLSHYVLDNLLLIFTFFSLQKEHIPQNGVDLFFTTVGRYLEKPFRIILLNR